MTVATTVHEAREASLGAWGVLGAEVLQPEAEQLRGTCGVSWKSWGEVVTVSVRAVHAGAEVEVRSWARLRTTLVDYGKNEANVEAVASAVQGGGAGPGSAPPG